MRSRQIILLSRDWAIAADKNQWIIQRRRKRVDEHYWQPIAYVGSTKAVLLRVLREKKAVVDINGRFDLDKLPAHFLQWRKECSAEKLDAVSTKDEDAA
jgi:hypothetical protein